MASDIFHSNIGVLLHFSIALVMHHRFHAGSYALCETHQIGLGCIHTKSRTQGARHGRKGLGWQHAMHSASGFCRTEPCLEKHPRFFLDASSYCLGTSIHSGPSSNAVGPSRAIGGESQLCHRLVLRGDAVSRARTSTLHHAPCVTRLLYVAFLFRQGLDDIPTASRRGHHANTAWAQGTIPSTILIGR